jgi:hypothetical protein
MSGDTINMFGNHNVGKMEGGSRREINNRPDSNIVWSEPLVFLNYRRTDEKAAADIEAEINRQLGNGAVFRDVTMRAGTEFPRELTERAIRCTVMLSIIGERWDDANGLRLLGDRTDWVRREIAMAFGHNVQVVPVLVGARGRLAASDLPKDIRPIAYLQAPHLRSNYDTHDVRRLVNDLVRDLPALAAAVFRSR